MTKPATPPPAHPTDLEDYLRCEDGKPILHFLACGAVDAGKSTLLGRLFYEAGRLFDDQIVALRRDSVRHGTVSNDLDLALLLDGLNAEREQGITIDVAYRSFATDKRRFLVADTPGHEEYTRNTATGASTASLAVVVVDARDGMTGQTKRHMLIASLIGIRHLVIAINKTDLVGFDQASFEATATDCERYAGIVGFATIQSIPVAARAGDNVARRSVEMPWYEGPTLLERLETAPLDDEELMRPLRYPVQHVLRPDDEVRALAGQAASGRIAVGDLVVVAKSGQQSRVLQILTMDGPLQSARAGQSVAIVLEDQIDVSRGDTLVDPRNRPEVADQFQAHFLWFGAEPMMPGRTYILKTECDTVAASITRIKHVIDIDTLAHGAAQSMVMNDIGVCNLYLQAPIAFDAYRDNPATGNFVLIDRLTNATVGAGMIDFTLRRAKNIRPQAIEIGKQARSALLQQRPAVVWLTGLSASGKSTIANALERLLHSGGYHTILLDGDNIRHGLNRDLGFTDADRVENIRRVAEVAKLMTDAGLIAIVSFISPFRSERQLARELMEEGEFVEVFVDTPIEECMRRDPKGLYSRAAAGEIANFTGIDSPYDPPEKPELHLQTLNADPADLAATIATFLADRPPTRGDR